jgi:hypothetical protein
VTRDERRRQKTLARRAHKKKHGKPISAGTALFSAPSAAPLALQGKALKEAAHWPLHECLIPRSWDREGELLQIMVARTSPEGGIGASVFLVDLGCLGVKDAFTRYFLTDRDFEPLRRTIRDRQPMVKADLDLVARIIREGVNYAAKLGFDPPKDFKDAAILLAGADPDASNARVPLGKDGKPFFVAGPHDDARKILAKLEKAVGRDGFHFIMPLDPSLDF